MASSAGLVPLPTSLHHSTTRLTHLQAHAFLSAFLDRAENDAAYRPDSTLTERGPQALSSGSTPNLTLSHLKRVLSGMEGKRIGGSLELEKKVNGKGENAADDELEGADEGPTARKRGSQKRALDEDEAEDENQQTPTAKKQKRKIIYSVNAEGAEDPQVGADVEAATPGRGDDDWQDAETYALAQTELDDDDAAGGEDPLEFEGEGRDEDDERQREEEEDEEASELDDNSDAAENQQHQAAVRKRKQRSGGGGDAEGEDAEQKAKTKKAAATAMPDRTMKNSNQEISKEERRKLKKMRRKDEKKERQRERSERKKGQ